MFWANTNTFKAVSGFLQSVWAEPTGKIFLVTVIAYSISYIIYSGYLAWFTGGVGSIPLSQVGFSAIDFFGLIPSVYLLLFHLASRLLKIAFRLFLIYILAPLALYIIAWLIAVNNTNIIFARNFSLASLASVAGIIMWMAGLFWETSSFGGKNGAPRWAWVLACIGALLAGLSTPFITSNIPVASTPNTGSMETNIFLEIGALFVLSFIFIFPYYMGLYLAQLSVNERVLSKVQKIIFKGPLEISGLSRETHKKSTKTKTDDALIFAYQTTEGHPVYLISMFSKNTALFAPQETIGSERGKLIIISNDEIRSMEINSGVAEKALYAK